MSGEKYPTLPLYIPLIKGLIKATQDYIEENKAKKSSNLGRKLLAAVQARFNQICKAESLLLAMVVDSRYKNRLSNGEEKLQVEDLLIGTIKQILPEEDVSSMQVEQVPHH